MKLSRWILAAFALAYSGSALAQYNPATLVKIPNIAYITSSNTGHLGNTAQFYLAAYGNGTLAQGDGGEGTFTRVNSCTDDGGLSCIHDADGNAFWRTNINGDLAQGGITAGSAYDARTCITDRSACSDASPVVTAEYVLVAAKTGCAVHTRGVPIVALTNFIVPQGCIFTTDTEPPGVLLQAGTGAKPYYSQPGYIAKSTSATITVKGCFVQGIIIPSWYTSTVVASVTNTRTLTDNVLHLFTGTGLTIAGPKACARSVEIGGFDVGIDVSNSAHALDSDWLLDNNNDIYNHDQGESYTIYSSHHKSMFGAQFRPSDVKAAKWTATVTGLADDGLSDHATKVTYSFTAGDDELASSGEALWLIGAGDNLEVDTFGDVPTCGSPPCTIANIPDDDIGSLLPGMTVSGACLSGATHVTAVDYGTGNDDGSVTIDKATLCAETQEVLVFIIVTTAPAGQNAVWNYTGHANIDSTHASVILKGSSWNGPTDSNASWTAGSNVVLLTNTVNWNGGQYLCASSCTSTSPVDFVAPTGFTVSNATLGANISNTTGKPNVAVSTAANWPECGLIRIDTEELGYCIKWGIDTDAQGNRKSTISINRRGVGGTTAATHTSGATITVAPPMINAALPSENVSGLNRAGVWVNAKAQSTQTAQTVTGANDTRTSCSTGCAVIAIQATVHTWTANTVARRAPTDVFMANLSASATATTLTVPYALGSRLQPGMNVVDLTTAANVNATITAVSSDGLTVTLDTPVVNTFSGDLIKFNNCGYPTNQPWLGNCINVFALNAGGTKACCTAYVHSQVHGVRGFMRYRGGQNGTCIDCAQDNGGNISPLSDPSSFGFFCSADCDKISLTDGKVTSSNDVVVNPTKNTAGFSITNFNLRGQGFMLYAGSGSRISASTVHGAIGDTQGIYVDSTSTGLTLSSVLLPSAEFAFDTTSSYALCRGDTSTILSDNWCAGVYGAITSDISFGPCEPPPVAPPTGMFRQFCDSTNSNHVEIEDSSGTLTDLTP